MTVTYTHEVADCKGLGCFWKLLFRWRGSIYKLIWPDLLCYTICYFALSFVYRFALDGDGRLQFERASLYCQYFTDLIPLSFVLGFYVSIVVQRWWAQWEALPWPDTLALFVSTTLSGNDTRGRLMRRTIMRYANLAFVLTFAMVSPCVKKRFPTLDHLVEAGLMLSNERKIYSAMREKTSHPIYWMPLAWAGALVTRARKEGRIKDDFAVKTIIDEITRVRGLCGSILGYDWISIPLVYTQVVTLAVYSFFLSTMMGRQFLDPSKGYTNNTIDFYIPIFTYLQFFFYMGWLKVAESLVNPFGEDDDDFEINWLVDRNLQVSYLIVDEMHNEHPELIQDMYWDEVVPQELPYTVAAQEFKPSEPHLGSTANMEVTQQDMELLPVLEETEEDEETGGALRRTNSRISNNSGFHLPQIGSVISFLTAKLKPSNPSSIERSSVAGSVTSLPKVASSVTPDDQTSDQLSFSAGANKRAESPLTTDPTQATDTTDLLPSSAQTDDSGLTSGHRKSTRHPKLSLKMPAVTDEKHFTLGTPFGGEDSMDGSDSAIGPPPTPLPPTSAGMTQRPSLSGLKMFTQHMKTKPSANRQRLARPSSQVVEGSSYALQMNPLLSGKDPADPKQCGKSKSAADILEPQTDAPRDSPNASRPPSPNTAPIPAYAPLGSNWSMGSHGSAVGATRDRGIPPEDQDHYRPQPDTDLVLPTQLTSLHMDYPRRRGGSKSFNLPSGRSTPSKVAPSILRTRTPSGERPVTPPTSAPTSRRSSGTPSFSGPAPRRSSETPSMSANLPRLREVVPDDRATPSLLRPPTSPPPRPPTSPPLQPPTSPPGHLPGPQPTEQGAYCNPDYLLSEDDSDAEPSSAPGSPNQDPKVKDRSRSPFRSTSIYKPLTPHQTRQSRIPQRGIGQFLQPILPMVQPLHQDDVTLEQDDAGTLDSPTTPPTAFCESNLKPGMFFSNTGHLVLPTTPTRTESDPAEEVLSKPQGDLLQQAGTQPSAILPASDLRSTQPQLQGETVAPGSTRGTEPQQVGDGSAQATDVPERRSSMPRQDSVQDTPEEFI